MRHALAGGFDNRTTCSEAIAVLSSAGDDSRPHHVFRPQNRGVVIQALPATS